jgi:TonB family protein
MWRPYLLGVLLLGGSTVARAQTVVAGVVTDRAKGSVLSKVVVELLNRADSVVATDTTRADGMFTLNTTTGGTYRIRLTPDGAQSSVSDSIVVETNGYVARKLPIALILPTYRASEVDRPAAPGRDYRGPRYPVDMLRNRTTGCVIAEYVVDERGRAEMKTFTVVRTTHAAFTKAVRDAVVSTQFEPAVRGGRAVRQLVRAPYDFSIVASMSDRSDPTATSTCT